MTSRPAHSTWIGSEIALREFLIGIKKHPILAMRARAESRRRTETTGAIEIVKGIGTRTEGMMIGVREIMIEDMIWYLNGTCTIVA